MKKRNLSLVLGLVLIAASHTSQGQTPPPGAAPGPVSTADVQVRTKQVSNKQLKFDFYIKDGHNQLSNAKNRFLAGRKDMCENNLILAQLRVDVTLSLMRDHPTEIANLTGFFVLKSTRDGYFAKYTNYNNQAYGLQDEIRVFAEKNGPFAAFNFYKSNISSKVIDGGEAMLPKIEGLLRQAEAEGRAIKSNEINGGVGTGTGPGGFAAVSPAARAFFGNPNDPANRQAFIDQAVAGGLTPAAASQLAAAFAAGDIRSVAQLAAQNPNSTEAKQALAALLQRLGVAQGLQQLGMTSEDAQAADAAFRSGNTAALEALKEKYKDNPSVVAALNALLEQLRSAASGVTGIPSVGSPTTVATTTSPAPAPSTTPTSPPPANIPSGGVPQIGSKVYDANGNLVDIWSGGADPSEGTRATYADEKGGRLSSEARLTRQFLPRSGGGYTMQESVDTASRTDWILDITPVGDPEPVGDGFKVTYEVSNLKNAAAKFDVLAWYDAKGQRVQTTGRTFTTVVPKGKFTIIVEGKTQTFKNPTPFRIKVEGGQ